jgi:hypothetical protein
MKHLMEEDEEAYKKQFSGYIKNGITSEAVSFENVLFWVLGKKNSCEMFS